MTVDIATILILAATVIVLLMATAHEKPARRIVAVVAGGIAVALIWSQVLHNRQTVAELEQHCPEAAQ